MELVVIESDDRLRVIAGGCDTNLSPSWSCWRIAGIVVGITGYCYRQGDGGG